MSHEPTRISVRLNLRIWRQVDRDTPRPPRRLHGGRRVARHVVPRNARRRQRGAGAPGARTPSRSTRIAAKASAACAASSSTASRTGPIAGPRSASSTCAGSRTATITIEPWRAKAFPVVKDLVVDRSAFDRVIAAGGYVSVNCGGAPDGNAIPISKDVSEAAMDSAACIGCGACVAACKNASAHLFMSSKISHLALLPQGQVERRRPRRGDDRAGRRRRVRELLERRRVRSGLPEGNSHLEHRAHDARIRQKALLGGIAARGGTPARHRGRRCARLARRDDREYREYLREEQRSQAGCSAGRMPPEFTEAEHHRARGLPRRPSATGLGDDPTSRKSTR